MIELTLEGLKKDQEMLAKKINVCLDLIDTSKGITLSGLHESYWLKKERIYLALIGFMLGFAHRWLDNLYSQKMGNYMLISMLSKQPNTINLSEE